MPSSSQIFATGMSRICGGSRLPASMISKIPRPKGIRYRLSANAASEARNSTAITVQMVTITLLRRAPAMFPPTQAVRKALKVNEAGHEPSPLLAMSLKLRIETRITKTSGSTHSSVTGIITLWKTHRRLCRRGPAAVSTAAVGARVTAVISLLSGSADKVGDDEGDRQQEDHDGDGRAVAQVHLGEPDLVHVRAQQLGAVVRAAAGHRPDDVEGPQ